MQVLIGSKFYFPGWKSGGAPRAVYNLVEYLGDEINFRIITGDRDLGDTKPYNNIVCGRWTKVGKAEVMYFQPGRPTPFDWWRILRNTPHDILYLTSFFAQRFTIYPLIVARSGVVPKKPVLLAPKGEFSTAALYQKSYKKRPYLLATRLSRVCEGLYWQASSEQELKDIVNFLPRGGERYHIPALVVPDLVGGRSALGGKPKPLGGRLRVAFLSRISRIKNLLGALEAMTKAKGLLDFDVFGPIEDKQYWNDCQRVIASMPTNIQVRYLGALQPDNVISTLSSYDLFFLPTFGENFGYVIVEAMLAGCPVLISDKTPWRNLNELGVGWDIPLGEPQRFADVLDYLSRSEPSAIAELSRKSFQFAMETVTRLNKLSLGQYRKMFNTILSKGPIT